MRIRLAPLAAASLALAIAAVPRDAGACGVAYPGGAYAHLASERTVIVWDEATHTEHFVRKPTFDGDAIDFGFFVPTPAAPTVAKVDDAVIDRVASLVPEPPTARAAVGDARGGGAPGGAPPVEVLQQGKVDDFEYVTLRATSASPLGDWLHAHGYVDRPSLRAWARPYLEKKWVITALRYAPSGDPTERRAIATPTLRFSFAIGAPFYPYTEPAADVQDESEFYRRHRGVRAPRPVDVWVVAPAEVHAVGNFLQGLPVAGRARVSSARVATALGDTSSWRFDPRERDGWVVTRMHEALEQRVAFEDLRFEPVVDDEAKKPAHASQREVRTRVLLAALALGLAALVAWAVASSSATDRTPRGG